MRRIAFGFMVAGLVASAGTMLDAHFRLLQPASWLVEDMRGDPQKIAPCGGVMDNAGTPSGAVTNLRGGQMLHFEVVETIFHPGHYRIALARSRDQLPADPVVTMHDTENGPRSLSAEIDADPQPPVIVDGLWQHTERPEAPQTWTTDIRVPNVDCEDCVIQIIEFMAEHPGVREGGFSYHHCADVNITADASQPLDRGW